MGLDAPGPSLDPDATARLPVPEQGRDAQAYLATRFPSLVNAPLVRTEMCQTVVLDPATNEEIGDYTAVNQARLDATQRADTEAKAHAAAKTAAAEAKARAQAEARARELEAEVRRLKGR